MKDSVKKKKRLAFLDWKQMTTEEKKAHLAKREPVKRSALPKTNPKRRAKLYERNYGAYSDIIRSLPCDVCGKAPPSHAAHAKSRGSGGDKRELVPLCAFDHGVFDSYSGMTRDEMRERAKVYWNLYGEGE